MGWRRLGEGLDIQEGTTGGKRVRRKSRKEIGSKPEEEEMLRGKKGAGTAY